MRQRNKHFIRRLAGGLLAGVMAVSLLLSGVLGATALGTDKYQQNIAEVLRYYKEAPEGTVQTALPEHYAILMYTGKTDDPEYAKLVPTYSKADVTDKTSSTVLAKMVLYALENSSLDPRNFDGIDLVARLAANQKADGSFFATDYLGNEVSYTDADAWAMIALDAADAEYDRAKAISAIAKRQKADKGFNDYATADNDYSSVDTTAIATIALARYENATAKKIVSDALDYFHARQDATGNIGAEGMFGGPNSNSQAMAVSALVAAGQNPAGSAWTKDGKSAVDALLAYQDKSSGGFLYNPADPDYGGVNDMSTYQSAVALIDLSLGKSVLLSLNPDFTDPTVEKGESGSLSSVLLLSSKPSGISNTSRLESGKTTVSAISSDTAVLDASSGETVTTVSRSANASGAIDKTGDILVKALPVVIFVLVAAAAFIVYFVWSSKKKQQ